MTRDGVVSAVSGIRDFKLLRLRGSAFQGFVRDRAHDLARPAKPCAAHVARHRVVVCQDRRGVHRWRHHVASATYRDGRVQVVRVRQHPANHSPMGTRMFADIPDITELRFEATNRTWDVIAERGEELGVYVDPPAPYGVLGLTLTR